MQQPEAIQSKTLELYILLLILHIQHPAHPAPDLSNARQRLGFWDRMCHSFCPTSSHRHCDVLAFFMISINQRWRQIMLTL